MATLVQDDPKLSALIEALYRVEGKAEIIDGKIVHLPMTGIDPGFAGDEIFVSLRAYARRCGRGRAVGDNKGFLVDLPRRKSFSPDVAFYTGPKTGMKFGEGAPVFVAEVRSEGDYGRKAEREMAAKRRDYFAAGTLVVWDVDLNSDDVVRVFKNGDAEMPVATYRCGDQAEAEPAVPSWAMPVDDLFDPTG